MTSVQHVSTLAETEDVRVAEYKIAPNKKRPYHYHTHVVEYSICLEGTVHITMSDSSDHILNPGGRIEIPAGQVHRVMNPGTSTCLYLVIQGPGIYDFLEQ